MTRNGKIARLPQGIREELNRRLQDGKAGSGLVRWLNEQPECQEMLDEEFDGRPITKQNLSEWRQGGYEDWVRKEEARLQVQRLVEKAGDLEREAGGMAIADRLGTLLAAELALEMERVGSIQDPKERWARLKDIARELYRLRREDHHARKLRMAEKQYERREKEAEKEKLLELEEAMRNKPMTASLNGKGDEAWKWADWMIRVDHGLPMPHWWTNPQTAEEWSKLMMPYWREEAESQISPKGKTEGRAASVELRRPKGSGVEGNGPKSDVQTPKSTAASRSQSQSKSVRTGQTESEQKSGLVALGPSGSESAMGNMAKTGTGSSGPASPPESEDEDEDEIKLSN